jgi:acetyltransferase-like isoleucine patch superfamily enzyme
VTTMIRSMRRRLGALVPQGLHPPLRIVMTALRSLLLQVGNWISLQRRIKGKGNRIEFRDARLRHVTISIIGDDNTVIIHENARVTNTRITVQGSNHRATIGAGVFLDGVELCFEDFGCSISIGPYTTVHSGSHIAAAEPHSTIEIGERCLFSSCVDVRTTDSHSIIALPSRKRINRGRDVRIGNHVWLGKDVSVLKGVTIGDDSIIGMKSLVASRIPSNCVASGIPASVLMHDVAWLEERTYE